MLSLFRNAIKSKVGVVVTLAVLGIIALAFALSDVSNVAQTPTGTASTDTVATVGNVRVTADELRQRMRVALENARQQNPNLDMATFVRAGGYEQVLDQVITGLAMEQYARQLGMTASEKLVDGRIASIPAFQGLDGQFSQQLFDRILAQQRITANQLRDDVRRDILATWMTAPTIGATQVGRQMALPYASLLLERRKGQVIYIPAAAVPDGTAPTDAEITQYYNRNKARYTIPERRVMNYAIVEPGRFDNLQPTDAEVTAAYQANRAQYAPSEQRTIRQVIAGDKAVADRIAAAVRGGKSLADAAREAGLEASLVENAERGTFEQASSAAVANAAFSAERNALTGPLQSPLGWHVLRVEAITRNPGKTIEQAREELVKGLRDRKVAEAMANLRDQLDSGITGGSSFVEIAREQRLEAKSTGPVLPNGTTADAPTAQPDPKLANVLRAGFAAEPDQEPELVPVGTEGSFALVQLDRIVRPTLRPLAEIRDQVRNDLIADRKFQRTREAATKLMQALNAGTALVPALQSLGTRVAPPQNIDITRRQIAEAQQQLPPPVMLMFSMAEKKAKLVPAPNRTGYFVVWLDDIIEGTTTADSQEVTRTRAGLGSVAGREYVEQLAEAAKREIAVTRNADVIARIKSELGGGADAAN